MQSVKTVANSWVPGRMSGMEGKWRLSRALSSFGLATTNASTSLTCRNTGGTNPPDSDASAAAGSSFILSCHAPRSSKALNVSSRPPCRSLVMESLSDVC